MTSVNATVIQFPRERRQTKDCTIGFKDGMDIGSRIASERMFWYGTLAGVGISGLIAAVLIRIFS